MNSRQSGETLACACGARLDVPTLRELKSLEPAPPSTTALPPTWGRRQGLIFLGLLLTSASIAVCGYLYFVQMPAKPDGSTAQSELDNLKPAEAWHFWSIVRHGMPTSLPVDLAKALERIALVERGMLIALGVGIAGLVIAASGLFVRPTKTD